MSRINTFIQRSGVMYSVIRNNVSVSEHKGLINTEESTRKRYIGFCPDVDIQIGDFLTNPAGDKFFVLNREVQYFTGSPYQLKCYIVPASEYENTKQVAAPTFHIQNAYGSVIGTQANVILNYNDSIQKAKEQIASIESPDKQELQQIISLLEMVVNNQVTPHKGLFSKFSAIMERHSWITGTVTSALLSWLTTQM
jgi:hypothetical protein